MAGFKSWRSYWDFEAAIRKERRYVWPHDVEQFLETVLETSESRKTVIKKDQIFWRAQKGHEWREDMQGDEFIEVPCAYPAERMKPRADRASDGRANAKGIPCLYLATLKETAMSEVQPWMGSLISVGQFKLLESVKIIDCSRGHADMPIYFEEPVPEEIELAVWSWIDRAFATPMTQGDDQVGYAATQIIAELFKKAGFGGVAYKSNFGEKGYNVALFDPNTAELINCGLYEVDKIAMSFSQQDNPYFVRKHYKQDE